MTVNNLLKTIFFVSFFTVLTAKSCILTQGPKGVKCLETFTKLGELAGDYDLTNPNSTIPTNEVCSKFKRCSSTFDCETDPRITYAVNISILFCDAIKFFTNEFLPCQIKLDSKTTECTRNWNPYPKKVENKEKMAAIQKEACTNYFGKDVCMKDEIIEKCGKGLWMGFRKHHLALNTIVGTCKFDEGWPQ